MCEWITCRMDRDGWNCDLFLVSHSPGTGLDQTSSGAIYSYVTVDESVCEKRSYSSIIHPLNSVVTEGFLLIDFNAVWTWFDGFSCDYVDLFSFLVIFPEHLLKDELSSTTKILCIIFDIPSSASDLYFTVDRQNHVTK